MEMNSIAKRQQGYRKSIRRQQLEDYKKNRRRELLESQEMGEGNQRRETYQIVLSNHDVNTLMQMDRDCLADHFQMLAEIVFLEGDDTYKNCLDRVLMILIDFFEVIEDMIAKEARERLYEDDEQIRVLTLRDFCLTKIFSFIPANSFLKIIGGFYYETISSINLKYAHKVIKILGKLLPFCFTDSQTIRYRLQQHFTEELDFTINKKIFKNHIFTILLNISSYSSEKTIMEILKQQNIFEEICDAVALYGIQKQQTNILCEIYQNCIAQLCQGIQWETLNQSEEYNEMDNENRSIHSLYIPLFAYLVNTQNQQITQSLVSIANSLIQTAVKNKLNCLGQLMTDTQNLIRAIIDQQVYIEQCQTLFATFVLAFKGQSYYWITGLFEIIMKQLIQDIASIQNVPEEKKKRSASKIKETFKQCQKIIQKPAVTHQQCKFITNLIFTSWINGDLTYGLEELIVLMALTIKNCPPLSQQYIFGQFSCEFLIFMGLQLQTIQQIQAMLDLIQLVCHQVRQADPSKERAYLMESASEWQQILQRIQGYQSKIPYFSTSYRQLCESTYNEVQALINQVSESGIY